MSKKHSLLNFFLQESTVAPPTFRQTPPVPFRTLDHLVCKRRFLQLDRSIVQYMDLSQWLKHSKSVVNFPILTNLWFLTISHGRLTQRWCFHRTIAHSIFSNCMSTASSFSSNGSPAGVCVIYWVTNLLSCRLKLTVDAFVSIRSFRLRLAFW